MIEFPVSPGPWKFGYTDGLESPIITDANDDVVCVMHDGVASKDGKLLAAAPELLVALEEILGAYSFYFRVGNPWGDKARAAISKATGQA